MRPKPITVVECHNTDDIVHNKLSGLPSPILTCTEMSLHWHLFVLVSLSYFVVSGYVC